MSNQFQEFLEYLDVQWAITEIDRSSCENAETRYVLKNKGWMLENVRNKFLKLFGDKVDAEKSALEAEDKARYQISQRPTIKLYAPGEYKSPPDSQIVKPEDYSEATKEFIEGLPPLWKQTVVVYKSDDAAKE